MLFSSYVESDFHWSYQFSPLFFDWWLEHIVDADFGTTLSEKNRPSCCWFAPGVPDRSSLVLTLPCLIPANRYWSFWKHWLVKLVNALGSYERSQKFNSIDLEAIYILKLVLLIDFLVPLSFSYNWCPA